ncbi:hypothetical protein NKR23_g813 [Pleurostoma richardsiae]|uniref:Rhodanese domain-containing protein n=1 Tax=Pleurostoma richardsiae TaxID=41990 RepID=A0AA38VK51_9PEZI|nr:hypothetical protein NKR23_g813 [Pleurostoma richardsiae]
MTTISNLRRLSAAELSKLLLAEQSNDPTIAVIDVRDDDHIGGHIKGSMNVPSRTLDAMLPTLIRKLRNKKTVVFHCALSQQRGPSAALRYLRERERILGGEQPLQGATTTKDGEGQTSKEPSEQEVYILDRGFVGWQEIYGRDERLTEAYRKELWEDGYWG